MRKLFYLFLVVANVIYPQSVEKKITLTDMDETGKRWAILIGVNDYIDSSIADLTKARFDAKNMSEYLQKKGEYDYIFTMTDDLDFRDPLFPTKANIETKVKAVADEAQPNDMVLIFFSGHGTNDANGNGYLLPVDTRIKEPNASAVQVEGIVDTLKNIKKSLLILDACREVISKEEKGIGESGLKEKKFEQAEISATLYSTKGGYVSYEDPEFPNGVYTNFLLAGLKGEADVNQDGVVSLSELDVYVQDSVSDWAIRNHKKQKPFTKFYKEKSGDIGIAKAQKKPTPKQKPAESVEEKPEENYKISFDATTLKSMSLPGWGQYSKGNTIRASLFFGSFLLTGGFIFSRSASHNESVSNYGEAKNLSLLSMTQPYQTGALPLAAMGYMKADSARNSSGSYSSQFSVGLGLLAIIYIYNILDAHYVSKPQDTKKNLFNGI